MSEIHRTYSDVKGNHWQLCSILYTDSSTTSWHFTCDGLQAMESRDAWVCVVLQRAGADSMEFSLFSLIAAAELGVEMYVCFIYNSVYLKFI